MPELEDIFGGTPSGTPESDPPAEPAAQSQPAATPATPTEQPAETQQPSFATSGLYARAQAAGLPLDGITDEGSFAEALLDRYMQDRAYADLGRSSLTQPNRQSNSKAGKEPSEPGDDDEEDGDGDTFDPDSHFNSLWQAPQINDQAKFLISQGIVQLGDNGLYEAKPGFEAMALPVLNDLNHAHVAQREQMQKLFEGNFYQNVYKGLSPALEHRFQQMLDERLQQQFQSYDQQTQAVSFEKQFTEQHKGWLYQPDGRLTADGEKFRQTVQQLRDKGITDPETLADYALKISGVNTQPAANPTPGSPPDAGRQRDEHGKFVKATDGQPAVPKPKQESFIDDLRRKANASSNQGSYTDAAGEFVPDNEGDLDNMFSEAWRKHKTGAAA